MERWYEDGEEFEGPAEDPETRGKLEEVAAARRAAGMGLARS